MKLRRDKRPSNLAARALGEQKYKQRIVKTKPDYSRKTKHKKREGQNDGLPSFHFCDMDFADRLVSPAA